MTISLIGLIILVVIAAIAGYIGQALVGVRKGGFLLAAAVGFIGALIGTWLSSELGLPRMLSVQVEGQQFPILWGIIGAMLFSLVVGLISRRGLI